MIRASFGYNHRLHHAHEFDLVFKHGKKRRRLPIALYFYTSSVLSRQSLGIIVSRHQGSAVLRNRVKRIAREAFRMKQDELRPGYYVVHVIAKLEQFSRYDLRAILERLFSEHESASTDRHAS